MAFPCLFVNLNIAAAQRATRGVAVTHDDREGVGILAGLAVVAYVHLESERPGVPLTVAVPRILAQLPRYGHGRDSGTLDGPGQNSVVLYVRFPLGVPLAFAFAVRPNVPLPPSDL